MSSCNNKSCTFGWGDYREPPTGPNWISNIPSAHPIMAATEAEALWDHAVDLSPLVLLTNALVRRQPRQSPVQVVVIWFPYDKRPSGKLDYTHTHTRNLMWSLCQLHKMHFIFFLEWSVLISCNVALLTCSATAPGFMVALCSLWAMPIKECLLWYWGGSSWEEISSGISYHFSKLIACVKLL